MTNLCLSLNQAVKGVVSLASLSSLLLGCSLPVWAGGLAVSPPIFEFEVKQKTPTQSFKVTNYSEKPVKLRLSVYNWTLDEQNQVQIVPPTEQSLDQWLVINPVNFSIAPGEEQVVRFAVRPRVPPQPGEHRAIFYLETVPDQKPTEGIKVVARLGVAAYGYVGEVTRTGVLQGVEIENKANPITVRFDISSHGNAHVRLSGQYAVWLANRFPGAATTKPIPNLDNPKISKKLPDSIVQAGLMPGLPILPGTRRKIPLVLQPLPPGQYVLDLNAQLGYQAVDKAILFTVER